MLNEKDDKYDGDDTEYHFSDEEVNYEVDASDAQKTSPDTSGKSSSMTSLLQSKRMLISGGVFIVLMLVVYKMVTPGAVPAPDTDINSMKAPALVKQEPAPAPAKPVNNTAMLAVQNTTQTVQMPAASAMTQPQMPAPAEVTPPPAPAPVIAQQEAPLPPSQAFDANAYAPPSPPAPSVPPILPVLEAPGSATIDSKAASLAAQNERLVSQLQTQYDQRINDYKSQNKNLQEQVQTLNSRVAGMESQLTQMMQNISHQQQAQQPKGASNEVPTPAAVAAEPVQLAEAIGPVLAYTVQAIIPGRAWLKSDNGETVTVAEGDTIKGAGRVTKIDPYDGVVEINTGKKIVALSYGNGG